jgi:hypothetical protein
MERRGPSHSGPYGLACASCFKAKSKCVAHADGNGCRRCHSLNRQCHPSDSIRRRAIDKKANPTNRIAELESKLESLISELQSRDVLGNSNSATQPSSHHESERSTPSHLISAEESHPHARRYVRPEVSEDIAAPNHLSISPEQLPASLPAESPVSDTEAESLFDSFRSCMLPHFPFLHLPGDLTAKKLRQNRPFLFRAVVCAASPSTMKIARGMQLRRSVSEAVLQLESQSSSGATLERTDLLLAILIYLSWGWVHMLDGRSLPGLMTQANLLACEILRLQVPASPDARLVELFGSYPNIQSDDAESLTKEEFLEQQRAVLGCFVLSSAVSAYYEHSLSEALRWTPQMTNALAAICSSHSGPKDSTLAAQVRLQLLAQKAAQVRQNQSLEQGQVASTNILAGPALTALESLQGQLEELRTSLFASDPRRGVIVGHIHFTELTLSEATYAAGSVLPIMISQLPRIASTDHIGANYAVGSMTARQERMQSLWRCVRAVQACSSALLESSPSNFRGVSFLQWAQLAHCAASLNWLTTWIEEPTWDKSAVREVTGMDVHILLGQAAEKLERAARSGAQELDEIFIRVAQRMRDFCSHMAAGTPCGDSDGRQGPDWPRLQNFTCWLDRPPTLPQ